MEIREKDKMIFGIRAVIEALKSGQDVEKVFVQKNLKSDLVKELYALIRRTNSPLVNVPAERLSKFTRKNHQGVVAFLSPIKYHDIAEIVTATFEKGEFPFVIVLDRVTDVRNFGAIARSASCMGATALLIPSKNAAQVNGDAMKTSAGALSSIPICRQPGLGEGVRYLKNAGCKIVGLSEKGSSALFKSNFKDPVAIILGSEEDGISNELLQLCDEHISIPMKGPIGSLNVSAAAAVCFYEVIRQRA